MSAESAYATHRFGADISVQDAADREIARISEAIRVKSGEGRETSYSYDLSRDNEDVDKIVLERFNACGYRLIFAGDDSNGGYEYVLISWKIKKEEEKY